MRLIVKSGPQNGHAVEVTGTLIIGREGDLQIDDPTASSRHAEVRPTLEGALEIEDLGSENGTFVNGERISTVTRLDGDEEVRVGTTAIMVEDPHPAGATRIFTSPIPRADAGPPAPAPPPTPPAESSRPPLAAAAAASAPPRDAFAPPPTRRRGWAETRKTLPSLIMTALIIGDAAALVIYFTTR